MRWSQILRQLLTQYPSGQKVDSTISSNIFGVKDEYIILGNGAAELIKALLDIQTGAMGIIEHHLMNIRTDIQGTWKYIIRI